MVIARRKILATTMAFGIDEARMVGHSGDLSSVMFRLARVSTFPRLKAVQHTLEGRRRCNGKRETDGRFLRGIESSGGQAYCHYIDCYRDVLMWGGWKCTVERLKHSARTTSKIRTSGSHKCG